MNIKKAMSILGLDHEAKVTITQLKAAYRDRMMTAHPDRGGTDDEASALVDAYTIMSQRLADGIDAKAKEKERAQVKAVRSLAAGTNISFNQCIWCHKKMHRGQSIIGTYECQNDGRNYRESVWASNRLTGFYGNGVFCSKACAVEYALEKTWHLADPFPPVVKIKTDMPDGAEFSMNDVYRDRPDIYRARNREKWRTGGKPIYADDIDKKSIMKKLGLSAFLSLTHDEN